MNVDRRATPRRVALVFGAGGPVGHAFHAGALRAIEETLRWDSGDADVVVGTSAGAQVGALVRAGLHGVDLSARVTGEPMRDEARQIAAHFVRPSHREPDPALPPSRRPASPGFLLEALRNPSRLRPGRVISALLPAGRVRLDAQAEGLQRLFGDRWPARDLWISAVHLDSGERVMFGAPGAPAIDVGTAVTCSCAVPGVYVPVRWRGLRYVDGGIASATHLDVLEARPLDLVIVLSPLSMFTAVQGLLRLEMRRLYPHAPVVAIEPREHARAVMGLNPMALERAPDVARAAYESTLRALDEREVRRVLSRV